MSGKEGTNESDRNLVQDFTVEQIQQLTKTIYSLNKKVTRLLALHVCLPITHLLILLLL